MKENKVKVINKKFFIHLVLILGVVVTVTPFIWMLLTSLKTLGESTQVPPVIFPKKAMWSNYLEVLKTLPFKQFYLNTIISTVFKTVGQLIFCSMAAYAFARINFPLKNIIFVLILSVLMVPGQIFLLPQYMIIQKLGLLNSITALILPGLFSAFGTFLLRQFFMTLPDELEEAAILDGCNHFQIYWKIMMPLAKPGLVSLAVFTTLWSWNDLMWPLIVNTATEKLTLSAGLASLQGQHGTNFPLLMSGSVMTVLPMLVLFIIFQKQFIEGIAFTGGK
ncbi:carbohydrate ABC transporter permease [Desnuesiella massiliensis]|uniref:carbohydrate ABC transporter permease n=1 Tax=Desnuesiella massiliensis TaxID=1650662 RepID=UPI0006E1FFC7|nr:carbohydrate ABC transporter permease [Desnuesiella massiliensis]